MGLSNQGKGVKEMAKNMGYCTRNDNGLFEVFWTEAGNILNLWKDKDYRFELTSTGWKSMNGRVASSKEIYEIMVKLIADEYFT